MRSSRSSRFDAPDREGTSSKPWVAVLKAAETAAHWHLHQKKKGATQEPFVNHLLEVASLVAEATEGNDPDLVVAALLHDSMEHQEVPRELIAQGFGEEVARLVEECTDDRNLEEHERKRLQVENAPKTSARAKLIKLADKTSNLRRLSSDPPPEWSVNRRLEYVAWTRKVAAGLRGTHPWLESQFDRAADAAETAVNPIR
jgi:guanosine-3',5'-bis(diphosphate) 3'-pyrophosphohydrolase